MSLANGFTRFENWIPNGRYTSSPMCDDTISLQFNRLLCTQPSRGRFGFLWWSLEFTTHGNLNEHLRPMKYNLLLFTGLLTVIVVPYIYLDVSEWCVVFIFQRTSRVHERQFGWCSILVQQIMEITRPLATIPSFVFLGNVVGQLLEIELAGGGNLCNVSVWQQQMVAYNLHVPKGSGDAAT